MCRLYGFIATEPTRLECSLVEAQNALLVQSDRDLRGVRNPDGWGIAQWREGLPVVAKNTHPAFADRHFVDIASAVESNAVIAHIRAATVGRIALENTHPFTYGPWAFAHNGTVTNFEHVATRLDIGSFGPPKGSTDSEMIFLWLINRMADHGLDPEAPADSLDPILDLLEEAVLELVQIGLASGAEEPAKLNFLLSDGRHLAASRWGNTLHWTFRRGIPDCAVCGTSHCPGAGDGYRAVVVASEPITREAWTEVPDGTIFGVDATVGTSSRSLISPGPIAG